MMLSVHRRVKRASHGGIGIITMLATVCTTGRRLHGLRRAIAAAAVVPIPNLNGCMNVSVPSRCTLRLVRPSTRCCPGGLGSADLLVSLCTAKSIQVRSLHRRLPTRLLVLDNSNELSRQLRLPALDDNVDGTGSVQKPDDKFSHTASRMPSTTEFGDILKDLGDSHNWAKEYRHIARRCGDDVNAWKSNLTVKAHAGSPEHVLKLLEEMGRTTKIPITPDLRNYYLEACICAKNGRKAYLYFLKLTPDQRNPDSFKKVMIACGEGGHPRGARKVLSLMQRLNMEIGHGPWDALVNAYAEIGDVRSAQFVLEEMKDQGGISPTTGTYNRLLKACSVMGNIHQAETIFKCIAGSGLVPNEYSYSTLGLCALRANEPQHAERILDSWLDSLTEETRPLARPYLFNHMLHTYFQGKDLIAFNRLFMKLSESGVKPDVYSFSTVVKFANERLDFKTIEDSTMLMLSMGVSITHYHWRLMMISYSKICNYLGLQRLMDRIRDAGGPIESFMWRDLIGIFSDLGKPDECRRALQDMAVVDDLTPTTACYLRTIRSVAQGGSWKGAHAMIAEMVSNRVKVSVHCWRYVIQACVKQGGTAEEIFGLIQEMQRDFQFLPNFGIWSELVAGFDTNEALVAAKEALTFLPPSTAFSSSIFAEQNQPVAAAHIASSLLASGKATPSTIARTNSAPNQPTQQPIAAPAASTSTNSSKVLETNLISMIAQSCPPHLRMDLVMGFIRSHLAVGNYAQCHRLLTQLQDPMPYCWDYVLKKAANSGQYKLCEAFLHDMIHCGTSSSVPGAGDGGGGHRSVLREVPVTPTIDSWLALVAGYAIKGHTKTALLLGLQVLRHVTTTFQRSSSSGTSPSAGDSVGVEKEMTAATSHSFSLGALSGEQQSLQRDIDRLNATIHRFKVEAFEVIPDDGRPQDHSNDADVMETINFPLVNAAVDRRLKCIPNPAFFEYLLDMAGKLGQPHVSQQLLHVMVGRCGLHTSFAIEQHVVRAFLNSAKGNSQRSSQEESVHWAMSLVDIQVKNYITQASSSSTRSNSNDENSSFFSNSQLETFAQTIQQQLESLFLPIVDSLLKRDQVEDAAALIRRLQENRWPLPIAIINRYVHHLATECDDQLESAVRIVNDYVDNAKSYQQSSPLTLQSKNAAEAPLSTWQILRNMFARGVDESQKNKTTGSSTADSGHRTSSKARDKINPIIPYQDLIRRDTDADETDAKIRVLDAIRTMDAALLEQRQLALWKSLLEGCAVQKRADHAFWVCDIMRNRHGVGIDGECGVFVIQALCASGDHEAAVESIKAMSALDNVVISPAVWQPVVERVCLSGNAVQCINVFNEMRALFNTSMSTYSSPTRDQWDLAFDCAVRNKEFGELPGMIETMATVDNLSLTNVSLTCILKGLALADDTKAAKIVLSAIDPQRMSNANLSLMRSMTDFNDILALVRSRNVIQTSA